MKRSIALNQLKGKNNMAKRLIDIDDLMVDIMEEGFDPRVLLGLGKILGKQKIRVITLCKNCKYLDSDFVNAPFCKVMQKIVVYDWMCSYGDEI